MTASSTITMRYAVVDVFTATPLMGNPVAVFFDADELSGEQMQQIANWTNLSETTFHVRAQSADASHYGLRIFTPTCELPFAGHPTLGSAHALLQARHVVASDGKLVQECPVGQVPLTLEHDDAVGARTLRLRLPPAHVRELSPTETSRLRDVLGHDLAPGSTPALIDVGPKWIVAQLPDAASVLRLKPDMAASAALERELHATGVTVFGEYTTTTTPGTPASGAEIEVRSFAPADGIPEDPVCGSGNGSVGVYRLRSGAIRDGARYLATQGQCVGRDGRVYVSVEQGNVFVAGQAVTTAQGTITL